MNSRGLNAAFGLKAKARKPLITLSDNKNYLLLAPRIEQADKRDHHRYKGSASCVAPRDGSDHSRTIGMLVSIEENFRFFGTVFSVQVPDTE